MVPHRHGLPRPGVLLMLALAVLAPPGCNHKAGTFPRPVKHEEPEKPEAKKKPKVPADYEAMEPLPEDVKDMKRAVPIRFVQATAHAAQWQRLDKFWTPGRLPQSPLGKGRSEIRIRVPLGLDDPTPYIPLSNPPTLGKWELGKRLFFDDSWLYASSFDKRSCASCHRPANSFTEGGPPLPGRMAVPTLINCVYNTHQFWDGRVRTLEKVVQQTLADEAEPEGTDRDKLRAEAEKRHVWSGVVKRLRGSKSYQRRFRKVFGTPPTQENIGQALATYLRTLLAGNSIYDRARQAAGGKDPQEKDFLSKLDLEQLQRTDAKKEAVSKELAEGYRLFRGEGRCIQCHTGANFTDNRFHNIGMRESRTFKTPTLRALPGRAPYFHDGSTGEGPTALVDAVRFYSAPGRQNDFRDPLLHDLKLSDKQAGSIALFLRALDGKVDDMVLKNDNKK